MREAVENKKVELKQSGTKIPAKDVDVLRHLDFSDLYGPINDGINKYNDCNTTQEFTNDMVGNADDPTVIEGIIEATVAVKLGKAKPVVVHEYNYGNTKLTNTELESNNTLGANIMEEKEGRFYEWADTYDEWNNYYYTPTEENESGSSHTFTGDDSIFKLTKTKHNEKSKTRLDSNSWPEDHDYCTRCTFFYIIDYHKNGITIPLSQKGPLTNRCTISEEITTVLIIIYRRTLRTFGIIAFKAY